MSYSYSLYSSLLYSAETNTADPGATEALDLMHYLPDYYQGIQEMEELQAILGTEIGGLQTGAIDVLNQAFVETATWSLGRWELELGLSSDPSKSPVSRREMIKAKLRGSGTTTPEMIQRTASAFSGGDVEVIEVPGKYNFEIRFVGTLGIPPNMAGLIQIIEEIKPAHLAYEFVYSYTWWATLQLIHWNTAHAKTWNELRTYK
ncbi:YmfQ family protein [Paenibacillus sp. 19GGS1-52]|uniref:putative phage tail protein n=1 Tax=Paenibacillus sp. 19GGS1-52 TaxID=2758563 RepID=UPI001EFBEB0F|nr:putative phage tail protein [Paenibacillus sp. 19GGS1-52]ULO08148.1 YmfQ family protein [Paenibacillus sp. 19GGS1-52]